MKKKLWFAAALKRHISGQHDQITLFGVSFAFY